MSEKECPTCGYPFDATEAKYFDRVVTDNSKVIASLQQENERLHEDKADLLVEMAYKDKEIERLKAVIETVFYALGCTDGDDIRSSCQEEVDAVMKEADDNE